MKIGYQGIEGSNSEEAAKVFVQRLKIEKAEYIPLISAKNVIKELERNKIDYGVIAIKNSYAGEVTETKKALEEVTKKIKYIDELQLEIHHSIFKKDKNVKDEELKIIMSHPQAIAQTKEFRKKNLPKLKEQEIEDTALAAKYLAEGKLGTTVAIISRKNAGLMYGLELMYENIEDAKDNKTQFRIYKLD